MKDYATHEMFKADNLPAWRIRQQSFREALEEACDWLGQPGHQVAVLDGPNVSRAQRQEIYDLAHGQLGFRVMFIECVCEDPVLLERNFKVRFSDFPLNVLTFFLFFKGNSAVQRGLQRYGDRAGSERSYFEDGALQGPIRVAHFG